MASLSASPLVVSGFEVDPNDIFDTTMLPITAFTGPAGGQMVVPGGQGYNLAVFVNSYGIKDARWVVPGDVLTFQSTVILGYQPIGSTAPDVVPPPRFSIQNVTDPEIEPRYIVTVVPVDYEADYVFRVQGVATKPDAVGPLAAEPDGYPELGEKQYLFAQPISGMPITVASVTSAGTGAFSSPVWVDYHACEPGNPDEPGLVDSCDPNSCEECVDGKCEKLCECCKAGECVECGGDDETEEDCECGCGDKNCGCFYGGDIFYPELEAILPGFGCCSLATYFDPAVGYCWAGEPGTESAAEESLACCGGKCVRFGDIPDFDDDPLDSLQSLAGEPQKPCFWYECVEETVTSTFGRKALKYKIKKCVKYPRTYLNYLAYLRYGYNTYKECCKACGCNSTRGACCEFVSGKPGSTSCETTPQKDCDVTNPKDLAPGRARTFMGLGTKCSHCQEVFGDGSDDPLPPNPDPTPSTSSTSTPSTSSTSTPSTSSTSTPPTSSTSSPPTSSTSSNECEMGSCDVLRDNGNPTEEELSKGCQVPCCCGQSGDRLPVFGQQPFCAGFDWQSNCGDIQGPGL